jgi:hypothetical protein
MGSDHLDSTWGYCSLVVKIRYSHALTEGMNRLGQEGCELVSSTTTGRSWINLTRNALLFMFERHWSNQVQIRSTLRIIGRVNRSGDISYSQS